MAESLAALKALQDEGRVAVRSDDLSRTHRERLLASGFIREVMKGWYVPSSPDEPEGESTAWYASFWDFVADYLNTRFADDWCLSPEQSISLHTGDSTVAKQLLTRSPRGGNKPINLLYDTSIFDVRLELPSASDMEVREGLRIYSLPAALIACAPSQFVARAFSLRAALAMIRDASDVLDRLLEGGHSKVAGRLAGAFRNIGRAQIADNIVGTMKSAGYTVQETDPFEAASPLHFGARETSPYINRLRMSWSTMREEVLKIFPPPPRIASDIKGCLKRIDDVYVSDAYNSLSIEAAMRHQSVLEISRISSHGHEEAKTSGQMIRSSTSSFHSWVWYLRE